MTKINLTKQQTDQIVAKIKTYFTTELNQKIGGFEAEFLMEFFAKEIGPHFYNSGLNDAKKVFEQQLEEAGYMVDELEKSTN
ncbi:DUF2164 domain-containing protein [Francisella adeliensis]|uniref:DUF2164 domain-containing protein n=1 Tax=Francisella adeliensis TaxID=2007306 RepID=A0A2Z4Y162_9GAMM|nr:DUF2164 domain-containing protein [Francisella adeliensis]AXA34618.1 hypothetical protein CDH04_09515 [Francisella adeliensis]MBK2086344.1 DUF2164 domain-containing protein [Francisella adeliensis]MBK2096559.1 DUF2164 domain-containing protein [Francisella adeliensis]QIW12862.1 DUF2164 domain-containing protein [Francisella adeliensis]QIW14739.1 DUF2164 domain-containing protein [Francisella adeliensis]